jgi:prepilin peptidase CpaA
MPLFPLIPLLAVLAIAATIDWRSRRIPNWLTLSLAFSGLLQSFLFDHAISPADAALGALIGFGLTLPQFALGGIAGGDVKLMTALGAWIGPWPTFLVFVVQAVIGLVIVLTQAAASGQLRTLFRNAGVLTLNVVHVRQLGLEHTKATGQTCRSVQKPLPYAVPVLLATLGVLVLPELIRRMS